MGDRRCCCAGCIVLQDEFDRGDSTSLGSDWSEEVGDSEIVSGELQIPSSGVVATVAGTGETDPYMRVDVICRDIQVGNIYRALCNVDTDPSLIYYYAELEIDSANVAWLRVGSSSGGQLDEVEVSWDTLGDDMYVTACRTDEGLYGTTGIIGSAPISTTAWDCVSDNGGRQAGLMNASASGDVEFDDFEFLRGFESAGGARCFFCDCECDGSCIADTLTLTFTAAGGSGANLCYCLDGDTITLTVIKGDDIIKWAGTGIVDDLTCSTTDTASFRLECDWGNKQFTLYDVNQHPGGTGWTAGSPPYLVPSSVACDPLVLTFPTITFSITPPCGGPCDCEYYITITE